ncbi:MAG: protoporphyrinogen oxidase [Opitutales bacterium]
MDPVDCIVVGGGLTGLATAHRLMKHGREVRLFDQGDRPGGVVHSFRDGPWLAEAGPNTLLLHAGDPAAAWLDDLGLTEAAVSANPAAGKRFILHNDLLKPLPQRPGQALISPLAGIGPLARFFATDLFRRPIPTGTDPSVAAFFRHRLGHRLVDRVIDPFIAGVFAGDPDRLSLAFAFPQLYAQLTRRGSLLRSGLAARRQQGSQSKENRDGPKRRLISFRDGLGVIPSRATEHLGDRYRTGRRLINLSRNGSDGFWSLHLREGDREQVVQARQVVLALPGYALADLTVTQDDPAEADRPWSFLAKGLPYASVSCWCLGFPRPAVKHPLDGFGFLTPTKAGRQILGTLFSSTLFPGRAPDDHVLLTTFVGGSRQPTIADWPEDRQRTMVREELASLLGATEKPVFSRRIHWANAIAQYPPGFQTVLNQLEAVESHLPGLRVVGPARGEGVSVPKCIAAGLAAADRIAGKQTTRSG